MKNRDPHLFEDDRAGAIYRTAARIIYQKGFDATSMSEIAEALQMTKPGLYYYVKGKKELLFSLMRFAMDRLDAEVVEPARTVADPEERLRVVVAQHARLLTNDQEAGVLAILMDEVGGLSDEQREAIVERKRAYFDLVRQTLEELRDQGRLLPVDPTVAAFSILGMVMWISRWYAPQGRLDQESVVGDITEIAVSSILGREGAMAPGLARSA